jgi:hypothetical protein
MKHALIIIAHSFIGTKLLHGQRKSIISCSDVFVAKSSALWHQTCYLFRLLAIVAFA